MCKHYYNNVLLVFILFLSYLRKNFYFFQFSTGIMWIVEEKFCVGVTAFKFQVQEERNPQATNAPITAPAMIFAQLSLIPQPFKREARNVYCSLFLFSLFIPLFMFSLFLNNKLQHSNSYLVSVARLFLNHYYH